MKNQYIGEEIPTLKTEARQVSYLFIAAAFAMLLNVVAAGMVAREADTPGAILLGYVAVVCTLIGGAVAATCIYTWLQINEAIKLGRE